MGGGKAGSVAHSHAVNLTLVVIYKGQVRRTWRTTGFIHVNISVRRYFSSFGRTPSSCMKAAQLFIHEAPGLLCACCSGYLASSEECADMEFCGHQHVL